MFSRPLVFASVAGSVIALSGLASAEEKKGGFPDEKTIMEAMMKAGTPGAAHKKLNQFEGSWDCAVKMWMNPAKPATESVATADFKWILGGRFLEEKVSGDFGGMKFEGIGTIGYDNTAKKYQSTWIDNMATGVEKSAGEVSDDGKTFTYGGECVCPVSGQPLKTRAVIKFQDQDKFVSEMYKTGNFDGKDVEIKMMEITYTRKK